MSRQRTSGMRWQIPIMLDGYHRRVDVMPVSEHEPLREAAQSLVDLYDETGELFDDDVERLRTELILKGQPKGQPR